MRILVTFAVEAEFAPWHALRVFRQVRIGENHWSGGARVYETQIGRNTIWIFLTGIGLKFFDVSLAKCFKDAGIDAVVSSGLAGSLNADYSVGDIVTPRRIGNQRDANGVATTVGLVDHAGRKGAKQVQALMTADRIIETGEEKRRLAMFGDAVDMESFHIVQAFLDENLPVTAIRAISDSRDEDLPMDFSKTIAPDGRVRVPAMLRQLLERPARIPDMVRFGQQSKRAARKLTAFLDDFVESLRPELLKEARAGVVARE